MNPGDLTKGLCPIYVNLLEVSALESEEMVRITFGAVTGPSGIDARVAVVMREDRAEMLANGILQTIYHRRKLAWDKAVPPKEKKSETP